jgi:hypothetical protein
MKLVAPAVALSLVLVSSAWAQEAVEPAPDSVPVSADSLETAAGDESVQADDGWVDHVAARDGEERELDAPRSSRCAPHHDGERHGQVWAEVGTGGYRSAGAVVTQPLGDCGTLTVGVSKTEGGGLWRRR